MNKLGIWLSMLAILLLCGCSHQQYPVKGPRPEPENFAEKIDKESNKVAASRENLLNKIEEAQPKKLSPKPIMPSYNPLEDRLVSFSMINEDLRMVLYAMAQSVGMNLMVDPDVRTTPNRLTLSFNRVPASTVLEEILATYDLYYEIKGNMIRIRSYQERIFNLDFLDTVIDTQFDVGGDVLGAAASAEGGVEGLSGNFQLSGKGASEGKGNAYDMIDEMIKGSLSEGGRYILNRMSGTLYVQDTPKRIQSIARLIHRAKEMLARQILIEARIIEVALDDEYKYGIDWGFVKRRLTGADGSRTGVSYDVDDGLVLQGIYKNFQFDLSVDALNTFGESKVVSNPVIRTKHGKPAVISVGTSNSYVKSTETTITGSGSDAITQTEVAVSKVFDGLILGVIPFIQGDGRITMLINPIVSEVDETSLELVDIGNVSISLPEVNIKEISSTIALQDGDVIILGGLIDNRRASLDKGVPVLSKVPVLGYLFRDDFQTQVNKELVIILTVRIV
jgi:MSHA type pilus biogenesis protein MshL